MESSKTSTISVEKNFLSELLQGVLGGQSVTVGEWQEETLEGGFELDSAIHRLYGTATIDGRTQAWSLIVKVIRSSENSADPQGCHYWKREMLAYQSGFLKELPGKLAAPHCYAITEQPDASVWIWMEDVKDDNPQPWSIDQYAQVARHLGQFNGAYLAGRPLPADPWVTHDWLRKYLEGAVPMMEFILQNPDNTIISNRFPGIAFPMMLALWDEYPHLLKVLDHLPQTFCHQDAFKRNLFNRAGELIAIDWSFSGIAPVGSELAVLLGCAFDFGNFPSSQANDLDKACFTAYLDGLRQAGWHPDEHQVRKGFTITLLLRYVLAASIGEVLPKMMNENTRQQGIEEMDVSPEKAGVEDAAVVAYLQSIGMEAIRSVGLVVLIRSLAHIAWYVIWLGNKRRSRV